MLLPNKNKKINNKEKAKKLKPQNTTHSKSKSRSISCTRSKENVRYKLKTDQNISVPQDFRKQQPKAIKIKPFLSIQEEITGKQSRIKKNQSIIQNDDDKNIIKKKKETPNPNTFKKKPKIQSTSQTCVLLNKKVQSQSILETKKKSKSKDKLYKPKITKKGNNIEQNNKKLQSNSNQYKLRLKLMMKQSSAIALQPLFNLNQNNLISVTSSSEIKFSSNVCSQKSIEGKPILHEHIIKLDQNTSSKLNIRREYNKKVQAVTKIQKIWRGYQTRKLLQQYIKQQEPRLKVMLDNIKSRSSQAEINQQQLKKLNQLENSQKQNQQYKSIQIVQEQITTKKKISRQNSNSKNRSIKQQTPSNLDLVSQIKKIQSSHLQSHQIIQQYQKSRSDDYLEDYLKDDIDIQQQEFSQHLNLYRHQRAIYSHEDISDYIEQSRKYENISQQESEQNIYQPKIIYQTNEEYIESRKNSIQNKNIKKKKSSQSDTKILEQIILLNQNKNREQNDNNNTIKSQQSKISTKTQYKQQVARIKQQQIIKWQKMINFIKLNFGTEQKYDEDSLRLLNQIIQESQKNKKWLQENQNNKIETNQTRFHTQLSEIKNMVEPQKVQTPKLEVNLQNKQPSFKKKKLFLNLDNLQNFTHANQILIPLQNSHHSESKSKKGFDKSAIKSILQSKYTPLKPSAIQDIITLRQQMLTQRYQLEYKNLNKLMDQNKINLNQFYKRVDLLEQYIKKEKSQIEKSKSEIQRGLKFAANVVVKTQRDARILGKRIGLSRSAQIFNRKKLGIDDMPLLQFNEKIELMQERKFTQSNIKTKNFFVDEFSDVEGSINSLDLNQEQEKILQQSLSSNKITLKSEKKSELDESDQGEDNINVSDVTDLILDIILFECALDIFQKPIIFQTFNLKYNLIKFLPKPISKKQCVLFVQLIQQFLPQTQQIIDKIYLESRPLSLKLLKSVRIYFDDLEDSQNQQNSTIIPMNSFQQAISKLWENSSRRHDNFNVPFFHQLSPQIQAFINKKERMSCRRREDLKNKRSEILILEMKTIFDAWNQYLQQYKKNALINDNFGTKSIESMLQAKLIFTPNQMEYFIQESKSKMIEIINDQIDENSKICLKNYEELCQNEAYWTSYTKYVIQIGIQIEILIVDMLFNEMCQVVNKFQSRLL